MRKWLRYSVGCVVALLLLNACSDDKGGEIVSRSDLNGTLFQIKEPNTTFESRGTYIFKKDNDTLYVTGFYELFPGFYLGVIPNGDSRFECYLEQNYISIMGLTKYNTVQYSFEELYWQFLDYRGDEMDIRVIDAVADTVIDEKWTLYREK